MRFLRTTVLVGILALGAVLPGLSAACSPATAAQAREMVERGADLVSSEGYKEAFTRFMDPVEGYVVGNLYLFAIDFKGNILANSIAPESIGGNALYSQSPDGKFPVQEMIKTALTWGDGWVQYEFLDPCTGRVSLKSSFVKRVGDVLLGAGYYGVTEA